MKINEKGVEDSSVGDIAILNYGKALTSVDRILGSVPVYSLAGITGFNNKPLAESSGIIVGRKGIIGTVYY
jgi:type I restriction enzyme S subunit